MIGPVNTRSVLLLLAICFVGTAAGDELFSEDFSGDGDVSAAGWHGVYNLSSSGGVVGGFAWVWHSGDCENLIYTDEYTVDMSVWSDVRFLWEQRINYNGTTPAVSVAVRVGEDWYVSKQTAVSRSRQFSAETFVYAPGAANWDMMDITTAARGATATADLTGNITAFGLYSDTGPVGGLDCTAEYDNFRVVASATSAVSYSAGRIRSSFNSGWKFHRGDTPGDAAAGTAYDDSSWEDVELPHNPPMNPPDPDPARPKWPNYSYEGVSWYRKRFVLDSTYQGGKLFLEFEAVNTVADVWVNGIHLTTHCGGYLPFTVDLTSVAEFGGAENVVAVKADNTDNPNIPVGNAGWLNWGGIYRDVNLLVTDRLHITDPVFADEVAGGGIFVTYPEVDETAATVHVKTHVLNENGSAVSCTVKNSVLDAEGTEVAGDTTSAQSVSGTAAHTFAQTMVIGDPRLWHPDHPHLYTLVTEVFEGDTRVDTDRTRIGIRSIEFSKPAGFKINGKTLRFMGANRMQDFPYVGYAMPNSGQRRDAILLKEAGFQFIRTSQYPHDPAFLDACDELGLIVMAPIPGFQHIGDPGFIDISYQNMRDLIRRDRNRPSVVLWELSLNETWWTDPDYSQDAVNIGHEEYPGDQCYVGGWKDIGISDWDLPAIYDIALRNADHDPSAWDYDGPLPLVINEYGHWRYRENPPNHTSDAHRADGMPDGRDGGELAMLSMAWNHQESHNTQRGLPNLCGDALWVGIDYSEYPQGVLDNFRLPKFGYYFYQSQRSPDVILPDIDSGPMVFIANHWTASSPTDVRVFSNCEQVKLYLNGTLIATRSPDTGPNTADLLHPPFTFTGLTWERGQLKAEGYIAGQLAAVHTVNTPGEPASIVVNIDTTGCDVPVQGRHVLFAYATVVDSAGTPVIRGNGTDDIYEITFDVSGPGKLRSPAVVPLEAGIATALVDISPTESGFVTVSASHDGIDSGETQLAVGTRDQNARVHGAPVSGWAGWCTMGVATLLAGTYGCNID